MNPMRSIAIEKITLNMGVGEAGDKLDNASTLLQRLAGRKPVRTHARVRNPVFKIKKGDPIGTKVTLRGNAARDFLAKALDAADKTLNASSFGSDGNFAFGVREYIDFPGAKYDPKIGMAGFDVCVTLKRKGYRIKHRRRRTHAVPRTHRITRAECIEFAKAVLGAKIAE